MNVNLCQYLKCTVLFQLEQPGMALLDLLQLLKKIIDLIKKTLKELVKLSNFFYLIEVFQCCQYWGVYELRILA